MPGGIVMYIVVYNMPHDYLYSFVKLAFVVILSDICLLLWMVYLYSSKLPYWQQYHDVFVICTFPFNAILIYVAMTVRRCMLSYM